MMLTGVKLRSLEDERFCAVLDLALDIRAELDIHAEQTVIPIMRSVVRFETSLPGHGINMRDRYCELHWKAAQFLKAKGYLSQVEYIDDVGINRWNSLVKVKVAEDVDFYRLVVMLTEEEERRAPGSNAEDLTSTMSWLEQLGDCFHRAALKLRRARSGSSVFEIKTEYDVQTLMAGLLGTKFEDIKPEENTPSYASRYGLGGSRQCILAGVQARVCAPCRLRAAYFGGGAQSWRCRTDAVELGEGASERADLCRRAGTRSSKSMLC
jgi:DpnII restriction endonuclease